jgi:hypothetical protein
MQVSILHKEVNQDIKKQASNNDFIVAINKIKNVE